MADRDYPVGKAQQTILDKLGIKASGFQDAQKKFDELGITVGSKRVGRTSVPVVTAQSGGSQRNSGGDYDVWGSPASKETLAKLSEWIQ
jgi:hypothetical protein